jgi:hypothetical protein
MTTQQLVNGMVDKYLEVFERAITAGHTYEDAHKVCAKFFMEGLAA